MKTCSRCDAEKPVDDFYFADARKNRRFSYCKTCHKAGSLQWARTNREQRRVIQKASEQRRRARLRQGVLDAYGHACTCCGETMEVVLDIDHIEEDGAQHREEVPSSEFYAWLAANDYPEGFQTLCRNCNWAKHRLGQCPHSFSLQAVS